MFCPVFAQKLRFMPNSIVLPLKNYANREDFAVILSTSQVCEFREETLSTNF